MPSEAIRYALASIYVSLAETASLATGKPVGELSGFLMRRMAEKGHQVLLTCACFWPTA